MPQTDLKTAPSFFSFKQAVLWPLGLWLLFTPFSPWLDLKITHFFYQEGHFDLSPFWQMLYQQGIWPGWALVTLAVAGLFVSLFKRYRKGLLPCCFLILTLLMGSGLIVHALLKETWGRPRPRQTEEFGGQQPFRPYYQPHFSTVREPAKSFACGHCSMGFYFFALALLGCYYRSWSLYYLGFSLAWLLGGLLSLARIAQGGHFLSDTLATALIMWLTAWSCYYFLLKSHRDACQD